MCAKSVVTDLSIFTFYMYSQILVSKFYTEFVFFFSKLIKKLRNKFVGVEKNIDFNLRLITT
jgi:hypothetical protein